MSIDIPDIERVTFFPGQRLTADDLTDLAATNRELRWLHNRSLHPWGVGAGLEVGGEKGATAVTVQEGYAVDRLGRELVLTSVHTLPIPAVPGPATFYLVANYINDAKQTTLETRSGVCRQGGSVRLADEPSLEWRNFSGLDEGIDVILGSILVRNCALGARVATGLRRNIRPVHQPYIGGGQTPLGSTGWQPYSIAGSVVGQFVHIDTSAANFRAAPQYMVNVLGTRVRPTPILVALGVTEIAEPGRHGFSLRVLFPAFPGAPAVNPPELRDPVNGPKLLNTLEWRVSWIGVEG